jgi:UPF0716 family protein affecting phage T7 exclusion
MKPALVYGAGRFGLFLVTALLLWSGSRAAGGNLNGLPLLLFAMVISSVLGIWVFARQRAQLAESMQAHREAKAQQIAERRARLDSES